MVGNVGNVLSERLDTSILAESHLSMSPGAAAATVGLFDAALNHCGDGLVSALRSRVAGFDLTYFFDIAAGTNLHLSAAAR